MRKNEVDFITMGCSKNLVDSERLMHMLQEIGLKCVHDPKIPQGEIVVINTCGFIADAKQESVNMILEMAQAKEEGRLKQLYVMGCLSQRYKEELEAEIPQVDKFFGKFDYAQLVEELRVGRPPQWRTSKNKSGRFLTTPQHYAYLKISEGCDRRCAYCAIPLITGKYQSRPMEEILEEVTQLTAQGVKEFQVIAQDLTYYGIDIDGKHHIAELIDRVTNIRGVKWIRLHYAYPNQFPWELLDVMRKNKNVCNYLDVALQHISDHMLSRMLRHVTKAETMDFIERLRREVPGIHLRTTLLVGFPGETEEDFEELMEFTRWARFERMGAFAYSEEEGTYSAEHYEDDVPEEVKQDRLNRLMALQQSISEEMAAEKVGTEAVVIIDRKEGEYYIGRTEFSSPEVDPEVL
ncbi:MAG: 30S ribosomal protein S12 methylthiotransferase RimO, partial [Prevotella sp.]|nr:30S ribosomal protein S12 methylthiotransferase RimO [Prevotella sp.]